MLLFQGSHGRHFVQQLTLPRLRSFNMADQELATLHAEIAEAKARRDKLEALEAAGVAVNQERLAGVQNELSALQVRLNNLMEKQGEKLSSRSPPPASSLVAPCMPANPRLLHVPIIMGRHGNTSPPSIMLPHTPSVEMSTPQLWGCPGATPNISAWVKTCEH